MSRVMMTLTFGLGLVIAVHAQDATVKTRTEVEAKTITYRGCVQSGTETQSFTLNKVVPVDKTTTTETGTSGTITTTTTTTYALVPDQKVELEKHIGHQVEVTGMLIPGGDSKVTTEKKIEREGAAETTVTERTKTEGGMPQFRVIAIKHLADSCQ